MAKISFTNLKLKINNSVKTFKIGDSEIEVLQYLPIEDKYDLIMITLQQAEEEHIYNPIKLEMYFNLFLVFMYTNINFTDKQKEDVYKLYDILESNGIINQVIELIPEDEYNELISNMNSIIEKRIKAKSSITNFLNNFITDLPKQNAAMQDILNNFNPEQYQNVIDFAKAANGGRDIN